jgi:hypothetical protein
MKNYDITLFSDIKKTFIRAQAKTRFQALLKVMRDREKDLTKSRVTKVKIIEA